MNGGEMIGLILGGLMLITPVVWILTKHQQKMTQLLHPNGQGADARNSQDIRVELASLREIVSQQTIALDNLAKSQSEIKSALAGREELQARIGH
jgi:hypothetical protein